MQTPIIHSNGTSAKELARGYSKARLAVEDALTAMSEIEFNARDYYPLGDGAWPAARDEHLSRAQRLRDVATELYQLEEFCSDFIKS